MPARTQEQRRAETRAQLLAAAADLFATKGFHATSAEAVAAAADRTTGALYDHFGGKDGLLVALLEQWVEQTIVELASSVEREADLDGRIAQMWHGLIRRDAESGRAWLLLEFELWLHAARDPEIGVVGAERVHAMRAGLAESLARWADEYGLSLPAPAPAVAVQLIALLIGAAFQHRLDPAVVPDEVVVDGIRHLLHAPAPAAGTSSASPPHDTPPPDRTEQP
jgi:AcrR family transcriptional regulator